MPHEVDYDTVVIGSGPAGATTARAAAEQGLHVLLVDKKQELGAPIQCSGAVSGHALQDAHIEPVDDFISSEIYGFAIHDVAGKTTTIDYRLLKPEEYGTRPLGYVVDRRRFDRHLMTLAERAGVEVWLKTEGIGYAPQSDGTAQLHLNRFGQRLTVRTRIIVGADGLQSQVGKWAHLQTNIKLNELASCLQFIVDNVETDGLLELITGHEWAPGGYAWVFPKGSNCAEVGLGVIRTMTDKDARWHLDHFIHHSFMAERFKKHRILEVQGGGVPLAAPLRKQYADNLILVGDAARHVNPITGGGIHTAVRCGMIAGTFLAEFLAGDQIPSSEHLADYQKQWMAELGESMWQLYDLKYTIFSKENVPHRDRMLYQTLSQYFSPESKFRKV